MGGRYGRSPSGRLLWLQRDGRERLRVALNRHGDLAALLDGRGRVTDSRVWDPFGRVAGQTGDTAPAVGFQGDWTDPESGQVWMGARWYDPAAAAFTSRDRNLSSHLGHFLKSSG